MTTFKQATFEGEDSPAKGFKFVYPEFANTQEIIDFYGEEDTVKVFNAAIQGRIRTKAKNDLGFNGLNQQKTNERRADLAARHTDFIIFTEQDATNWRPDVREETSNMISREIKKVGNDQSLSAEDRKAKVLELSNRWFAAVSKEQGVVIPAVGA